MYHFKKVSSILYTFKKKKKSLTRYNYLFIFWFYRKYKVVLYSFKYSHNLICDKFYILNT